MGENVDVLVVSEYGLSPGETDFSLTLLKLAAGASYGSGHRGGRISTLICAVVEPDPSGNERPR